MPTIPKPRWDSRTGKAFSCYSILAPSKREAAELAKKLEEMLAIQVPPKTNTFYNESTDYTAKTVVTFNDYLRRLICRYRTGYFLSCTQPKRGEVERTLNRIEKMWRTESVGAAMQLIDRADHTTYHLLWDALPLCNAGVFYDPENEEQINSLMEPALAHARDNLKYIPIGKGSPKIEAVNIQLAENIAHTFIRLGLQPTKARGGLFDRVISEIFIASRYNYKGVEIAGLSREDNFRILKQAIDTAKEKGIEEDFTCWSEDPINFVGIS